MKTLVAALALTVAASAPALADSAIENMLLPPSASYNQEVAGTFGFTGVSDAPEIRHYQPQNDLLPSGARPADEGNVFGFRAINRTADVVGLGAAYQSPAQVMTDFGSGR